VASQQTEVINLLNDIGNLVASIQAPNGVREQVDDIVRKWNSVGALTIVNALATAPANTDGSLGTADGSPNNAHPIDTRIYASLLYPRSANDFANAVTAFQALQNYFTGGGTVPTLNRDNVLELFRQG
jgi:hypothetical protein